MHLDPFTFALWVVTTLLEGALCVLAVHTKSYRRLPLFTIYAGLLFLRTLVLWYVYYRSGFYSKIAGYFSWITHYLLIVARCAVCVELSRALLAAYRGLWLLARLALLAIAIAILTYAAIDAFNRYIILSRFIPAVENCLELAVAVILLSSLLISVRYRIPVDPGPRLIAVGLCFFSLVEVLNFSFVAFRLEHYFSWWNHYFSLWNYLRTVSFQVALVLCIVALRRRALETAPSPTLLPQATYETLGARATGRLRQLDQDLRGVTRP